MKWIVKQEEGSERGLYPATRSEQEYISRGIIILNKPSGPTSHMVDAWVKQMLGIDRCSHGGTLDPRTSGVLVIALEKSTKLMSILLASRKEYVALINIHKELPRNQIEKACMEFKGKQEQLPPKRSAVARKVRTREVYELEILGIDGRDLLVRLRTDPGFYVRRFADDLGKRLGCGAHMQELRRISSGSFRESDAINLQQLSDAIANGELKNVVKPMEMVIDSIKQVVLKDSAVDNIRKGSPLYDSGVAVYRDDIEVGDMVAMLNHSGELIAIGVAKVGSYDFRKKGIVVKTDRVI